MTNIYVVIAIEQKLMFGYIRWRREKAAERKKLEALGLLPKSEEYSPAKNKQVNQCDKVNSAFNS